MHAVLCVFVTKKMGNRIAVGRQEQQGLRNYDESSVYSRIFFWN